MTEEVWTCQVGQPGHVCGRPAVGMIAVGTRPTGWSDDTPTRGVTHICDQHWLTAPGEWDMVPAARPPLSGGKS